MIDPGPVLVYVTYNTDAAMKICAAFPSKDLRFLLPTDVWLQLFNQLKAEALP